MRDAKPLKFLRQFTDLIVAGEKRTSIRGEESDFHPGDALALMERSDGDVGATRIFSEDSLCLGVAPMGIDVMGDEEFILLGGRVLGLARAQALAQSEGFMTVTDLIDCIRSLYGLPFAGKLITWAPPIEEVKPTRGKVWLYWWR